MPNWNKIWNKICDLRCFSDSPDRLWFMVLDDEQSRMEVSLRSYLETFAAIVRGGFDYYFHHYGDNSFRHTPRTRANIINDHIVDVAKQFFAEKHPEIGSFAAKGRRLFQVPDAAILHFKKLDRQKRPCNYPTLFAIRFNDPDQFLPGFGPLPRLAVGYVPSRDWTRIDSIFITRPDGKEVRWSIELGGGSDSPQPLTISKPNAPTPSQRRAQPKGGSADTQGAGES